MRMIFSLREYLESDIDLGDVVFDPQRKNFHAPYEENTQIEDRLYNKLDAYINNNRPMNLDTVRSLRALMHDPKYSDFFAEPDESLVVYRGMGSISPEILSGWLKTTPEKLSKEGECDFDGLIRHHRGYAMSFTIYYPKAESFSIGFSDYSVIVHAKVADNPGAFLDFNKDIYKMVDFKHYEVEKECLALKPVKICKIEWKKPY